MAFKKLSYHLYDATATIKCDHDPLQKFFTLHILNSKVIHWGTQISSIFHVNLEHTKRTANIFADHIS